MANECTYYFKHDIIASDDEKIMDLLMVCKAEGYGVYWLLLEYLAKQSDYVASLDFNRIAWKIRCSSEMVSKVVMKFGLFQVDEESKTFYSKRLKEGMERLDDTKKARSEAGKLRGKSTKKQQDEGSEEANAELLLSNCSTNAELLLSNCSTNAELLLSNCSTNAELLLSNKRREEKEEKEKEEKEKKEKKEKEKKEKEEKENPTESPQGGGRAKFVAPTPDEVEAYCKERGNGITGEEFCDFYESKGWMVGKNHMKDWRAAVRTWEKDRKKRQASSPKLGYGEYMDGERRTYGSGKKTVPLDAPKRPGDGYVWNDEQRNWVYGL